MRTLTKTLMTASLIATGGIAVAQTATIENADQLSPEATIAENAAKVQNFSTLLAAAEAAGLADDLTGAGPYTVFAPTDEAFARLPEGTLDTLLQPENVGQLEAILKAHIVPGTVTAADLISAFSGTEAMGLTMSGDKVVADTLTSGENLYFGQSGGDITVAADIEGLDAVESEAKIIATDIQNSNGVIHVIDAVLTPQS